MVNRRPNDRKNTRRENVRNSPTSRNPRGNYQGIQTRITNIRRKSTKALVRISELTKIIELMANEIWALEMPQNGINYKQTRADIIQYFTKKAREAK